MSAAPRKCWKMGGLKMHRVASGSKNPRGSKKRRKILLDAARPVRAYLERAGIGIHSLRKTAICDRTEALVRLLTPLPDDWLSAQPVGKLVNNPRNEDPRCIERRP